MPDRSHTFAVPELLVHYLRKAYGAPNPKRALRRDEAVAGRTQIHLNARDLLEDVRVLSAARRFPRAGALTVLALEEPSETRAQVARSARFTAKAIGLECDLRDDEFILDDRYHAGTYGIPDASTLDAMRLAARLEALITDPVCGGNRWPG